MIFLTYIVDDVHSMSLYFVNCVATIFPLRVNSCRDTSSTRMFSIYKTGDLVPYLKKLEVRETRWKTIIKSKHTRIGCFYRFLPDG